MPQGIMPFVMVVFTALVGLTVTLGIKMVNRVGQLEIDMARLGKQIEPLWGQVQARCIEDLHHPNPRYEGMDILLEKLEKLTITNSERNQLKVKLVERSKDFGPEIKPGERESAQLMILAMDKVVIENANIADKLVNGAIALLFGTSAALSYMLRNLR